MTRKKLNRNQLKIRLCYTCFLTNDLLEASSRYLKEDAEEEGIDTSYADALKHLAGIVKAYTAYPKGCIYNTAVLQRCLYLYFNRYVDPVGILRLHDAKENNSALHFNAREEERLLKLREYKQEPHKLKEHLESNKDMYRRCIERCKEKIQEAEEDAVRAKAVQYDSVKTGKRNNTGIDKTVIDLIEKKELLEEEIAFYKLCIKEIDAVTSSDTKRLANMPAEDIEEMERVYKETEKAKSMLGGIY